jgi:hypothetical protein
MKQLKHLKLFEAFESIKLGKTLKFVSVSAKSQFLESLNPISRFLYQNVYLKLRCCR